MAGSRGGQQQGTTMNVWHIPYGWQVGGRSSAGELGDVTQTT
jgi:hypothetical protein